MTTLAQLGACPRGVLACGVGEASMAIQWWEIAGLVLLGILLGVVIAIVLYGVDWWD